MDGDGSGDEAPDDDGELVEADGAGEPDEPLLVEDGADWLGAGLTSAAEFVEVW